MDVKCYGTIWDTEETENWCEQCEHFHSLSNVTITPVVFKCNCIDFQKSYD